MAEVDAVPISIVVAVRNGADTLQGCLDSVFAQDHPGIDLVVIDGASDDGTVEVIEQNASRIDFWESAPDRGIYHAFNKALGHTRGEWIYFLGSDDQIHAPDVLSRMATHLAGAEGRHRIVYGRVNIVDAEGEVIRTDGRPWSRIRRGLREDMMIPHQATFHHRSLFHDSGGFDETFRLSGDYELLLRELLDNDPAFVDSIVVADMGAGGLSARLENAVALAIEFHRARRMHGLTRTPEWRSFRVLRVRGLVWISRTFGPQRAAQAQRAYRRLVHRHRRRSR